MPKLPVYMDEKHKKQRVWNKTYRQTNRERLRLQATAWYHAHPEKSVERSERLRWIVLTGYSNGTPKCVRCGITDIEVLELDHIANDGARDRQVRGVVTLWRTLIRECFPSGYQVLCRNCNFKKERIRRREDAKKRKKEETNENY